MKKNCHLLITSPLNEGAVIKISPSPIHIKEKYTNGNNPLYNYVWEMLTPSPPHIFLSLSKMPVQWYGYYIFIPVVLPILHQTDNNIIHNDNGGGGVGGGD